MEKIVQAILRCADGSVVTGMVGKGDVRTFKGKELMMVHLGHRAYMTHPANVTFIVQVKEEQ